MRTRSRRLARSWLPSPCCDSAPARPGLNLHDPIEDLLCCNLPTERAVWQQLVGSRGHAHRVGPKCALRSRHKLIKHVSPFSPSFAGSCSTLWITCHCAAMTPQRPSCQKWQVCLVYYCSLALLESSTSCQQKEDRHARMMRNFAPVRTTIPAVPPARMSFHLLRTRILCKSLRVGKERSQHPSAAHTIHMSTYPHITPHPFSASCRTHVHPHTHILRHAHFPHSSARCERAAAEFEHDGQRHPGPSRGQRYHPEGRLGHDTARFRRDRGRGEQ